MNNIIRQNMGSRVFQFKLQPSVPRLEFHQSPLWVHVLLHQRHPVMPDFNDFPPEISLQIFPNMRLKGLISARGVSKRWAELISLADIHPARLGLLELYQKTVHDPLFLRTRPWTLENLRAFDRQAYIDALLAQHNYIPDDFRFWILEWPARAAIACAWPGLPDDYTIDNGRADDEDENEKVDHVARRIAGCNFLGRIPPLVHRITLDLSEIGLPFASSDGEGLVDEVQRESRRLLLNASDGPSAVLDDEEDSDPEEYYRTHDKFNYSPPPRGIPVYVTFPALIVWEGCDGRQTWLALAPDTPFAVYELYHTDYVEETSRQLPSWTSWLAARLRWVHRQARIEPERTSVSVTFCDAQGNPLDISADEHFRSRERYERSWTADDEARYVGQYDV